MAQTKINRGDTTSAIARKYGITLSALMALNKGNPSVKNQNLIIAGGNINVPDAPVVATKPATPVVTPVKVVTTPPAVTPTAGTSNQLEIDRVKAEIARVQGEIKTKQEAE